jgi:hypothetical protein
MQTMRKTNLWLGIIGLSVWVFAAFPQRANAEQDEQRLEIAAHDFRRATEHFHDSLHDRPGSSQLTSLAHRLSNEAERFHDSTENNAPREQLRRDFTRARLLFNQLDRRLDDAYSVHDDDHIMRDWRKVENSGTVLADLLGTRLWMDYPEGYPYGRWYYRYDYSTTPERGDKGSNNRRNNDRRNNERPNDDRRGNDERSPQPDRSWDDFNDFRVGPLWFRF